MKGKIAKKIRKYIENNLTENLILLRNEFGSKTEQMDKRSVYQNTKKLYNLGKIKIN